VYDAEVGPGSPIAGAVVGVLVCEPRTFQATAGADGRYSLLVPGAYLSRCAEVTLMASASGYLLYEERRMVDALRASPLQDIGLWPEREPTPTATTTVWPTSSLLVHKMVDKEYVGPGELLSYTIVMMNDMLGGGDPGTSVTVSDTLPTTLAYVTGSLSSGATYDEPTRTIHWEGQVPRGGSVTITFAAQLTAQAAEMRSVSNWVHVVDAYGRMYERQAQTHILHPGEATPTCTPTGTRRLFLPVIRRVAVPPA
jgi:uncharacterized repeat protein (TIGR01451 family)